MSIKTIFLIGTYILLFTVSVFSQPVDRKNDSAIYAYILNQPPYNKEPDKPVCDTTYLGKLKKFDFKNTDLNRWDGRDTVLGLKDFLKNINVDAINDYKLTISKLNRHPFISRSSNKPSLSFSRVIYSGNKKLAICLISEYSGPEEWYQIIYILQFKDDNWKIVKSLLITIS